ncbi:MAG: hypothetical protein WBQ94_14250 [Terracidiphilus sp.]
MARGGDTSAKARAAGKRVGRPPKPKVEAKADKAIAARVLGRIDEEMYWLFLLHYDEMKDANKRADLTAKDRDQIGTHLERLTNRRDGTAPQRIDSSFNPETPLRIVIDHIGRPKDQAAAEAKFARGPVE